MKITDKEIYEKIEMSPRQMLFFTVIILAITGSCTAIAFRQQQVELIKTQVEQDAKSERGHWLWGHWDDLAEKKSQNKGR